MHFQIQFWSWFQKCGQISLKIKSRSISISFNTIFIECITYAFIRENLFILIRVKDYKKYFYEKA